MCCQCLKGIAANKISTNTIAAINTLFLVFLDSPKHQGTSNVLEAASERRRCSSPSNERIRKLIESHVRRFSNSAPRFPRLTERLNRPSMSRLSTDCVRGCDTDSPGFRRVGVSSACAATRNRISTFSRPGPRWRRRRLRAAPRQVVLAFLIILPPRSSRLPLLPVVVGGVAKDAERVEEAVGRGDDDILVQLLVVVAFKVPSSSLFVERVVQFDRGEASSSLRSSICFLTTTTAFFVVYSQKAKRQKYSPILQKSREDKKETKKKGERYGINPKP